MRKERDIFRSVNEGGSRQVQTFPEPAVFGCREQAVGRVCRGLEPAEETDEIWFRHYGASETGPIRAALEMDEDGAPGAGKRRVGIVADFDEPAVGGIAQAHPLFFEPTRRRGAGLKTDMAVVFRECRVVHPRIAFGDGVERVVASRGKRGIGGEYSPQKKDAGGSTTVLLDFFWAVFLGAEQAAAPCESIFVILALFILFCYGDGCTHTPN